MKKFTLLLILMTIPNWAVASNSNSIHTNTNTPIELKSISANSLGIRVAVVCLLGQGDCGGGSFGKSDEDMTVNPDEQCKNDGFDKD